MKLPIIFTEQAKIIMETYPEINFAPARATEHAAGYDIRACIDQEIIINPFGAPVKIGAGFSIDILAMQNYLHDKEDMLPSISLSAILMPRSSIRGLQLANTIGLIDPDYQGEFICKFVNYSDEPIVVTPGERMAQFILTLAYTPELVVSQRFDQETARGTGGFGHTGKF